MAIGIAAGGATGLMLKKTSHGASTDASTGASTGASAHTDEARDADEGEGKAPSKFDYIKMTRQFIVPVIGAADVHSLVLIDLNLEIAHGAAERVYAQEPKLRDAFLRELYRLAYTGAFNSQMLSEATLSDMHTRLLAEAKKVLGEQVNDVLIGNLVRQDL